MINCNFISYSDRNKSTKREMTQLTDFEIKKGTLRRTYSNNESGVSIDTVVNRD